MTHKDITESERMRTWMNNRGIVYVNRGQMNGQLSLESNWGQVIELDPLWKHVTTILWLHVCILLCSIVRVYVCSVDFIVGEVFS